MTKLYQYTIYKQDGTIEELKPCKKKEFGGIDGLYSILDCRTIELIPMDYVPKELGRGTYFGDEEARFNSNNHTNPHMKTITDVFGSVWDVVGDIVKESVYKGESNE